MERRDTSGAVRPLRLMIYDATCRGRPWFWGLTHSWIVGGWWYRLRGCIDGYRGVRSWSEALDWLASVEPGRPIEEIQFWGHGKWGCARVDGEALDVEALSEGHRHRPKLEAVADRMDPGEGLWWFRTCETVGCRAGHEFARRWSRFFNCRVAGHTYIIGPWQSGLHCIGPGEQPDWPLNEGLAEGTPDNPKTAQWSGPFEPNTITCLHNDHPELRRR